MTQTARSRLLDYYGTPPEKVFVIPHGAADSCRIVSGRCQPAHGADLGLLGPGKGIEHAIDAMAMLRARGLYGTALFWPNSGSWASAKLMR